MLSDVWFPSLFSSSHFGRCTLRLLFLSKFLRRCVITNINWGFSSSLAIFFFFNFKFLWHSLRAFVGFIITFRQPHSPNMYGNYSGIRARNPSFDRMNYVDFFLIHDVFVVLPLISWKLWVQSLVLTSEFPRNQIKFVSMLVSSQYYY